MNNLKNVLMELNSVGMKGAFLVGNDGLLIESVSPLDDNLDAEAVAALAASVLVVSRILTENLRRSPVEDIVVRLEHGGVIMRTVAKDVIAVVLTDTISSFAWLRMRLRRLAPKIAEALSPEIAMISRATAPVAVQPHTALVNGGTIPTCEAAPQGGFAATNGTPSWELSSVGSIVVDPRSNRETSVPTALGEGAAMEAVGVRIAPEYKQENAGLFRGIALQPESLNAEWPPYVMTNSNVGDLEPDVVVREARLDLNGSVATATVELAFGDLQATGKALGRNTPERHLRLIAEATARAMNELLSPGYGVVVHDIVRVPVYTGYSLHAQIIFITPAEDQRLLGVMPIDHFDHDLPVVAAKTVLSAVHQHVGSAVKVSS
jgi:predicted regulator of Ras-like GTPase activity (Roadblock/LC7/MglB family)